MLVRILTGVVGIPLAVLLIFVPHGLPFAIAMGVISVLGVMEFYRGVRKIGARPVEWTGVLAVLFFVFSARTFKYGDLTTIGAIFPTALTLLLILSFCVEMTRRERAPIINVGSTVFGAIYVGWLISHLVVLRGVWLEGMTSAPKVVQVGRFTPEIGACLVMMVFLCTWACDTSAYFLGRAFGKTKIAPNLSPNKTIEGSIAGLLGTLVVAMISGWVIHLPWYHSLAMGAIFGVLSQLGDLSESAIKRELKIKDFGTLVPGHGGVLDRFDSLLFSGPAAYYYALLFLQNWPK
ncbi:MAG: phosphatidate cytidylyltransferase [Armatimonadota bacterium]|jgi:phosphatidate cytidylyltransferase